MGGRAFSSDAGCERGRLFSSGVGAAAAADGIGAEPPPAPMPGQRSLSTPFLDPAMDDMISWGEDGSTFVMWRPAELTRDLLPKYFKHNYFSSFV
ncbi:heat stress transcription factor B-2c-like [Hordeum vulgare subsp. vulgare]|uniref:heat stress transcription factor B-2c-like n=1 Tax=Hordeum vulgare subsp. vulgare TaxID=112509 RepID=UPI001D1A4E6B|nr:heat stress transcription factor B-2c-like [Hordeum vulgare subsp. vulgare]